MLRNFLLAALLTLLCGGSSRISLAQTPAALPFPVGTIVPSVTCDANPKQTYALYLPSSFSAARRWPVIYVFDPGARGQVAAETVRAAAEKFGYIVAASNNSRNGPLGGTSDAVRALWQDTQTKFPVDEHRRYSAGMSGGARVAVEFALGCHDCLAGVIANAAGFPAQASPPRNMKFAYFAAVGDSDFNYPEFVELRKKLDEVGARYRIRVFEGPHDWAPPETWVEALNWMDIRAMAAETMPRDPRRIQETLHQEMARAQELQARNDLLGAAREYQSVIRDFEGLEDLSPAKAQLAELVKDKALKKAEQNEKDAVSQQGRLTEDASAKMQAISSGNLDAVAYSQLRSSIADLKNKVTQSESASDSKSLVLRRALGGLVVQAFESGRSSIELKMYAEALQYFDLAAAGAKHPQWAHYQQARAYAMMGDRKGVIAALKLAVAEGLNDVSAMEVADFQAYRQQPQFQALLAEVKAKATQ